MLQPLLEKIWKRMLHQRYITCCVASFNCDKAHFWKGDEAARASLKDLPLD